MQRDDCCCSTIKKLTAVLPTLAATCNGVSPTHIKRDTNHHFNIDSNYRKANHVRLLHKMLQRQLISSTIATIKIRVK
jgi:hypothetical protein